MFSLFVAVIYWGWHSDAPASGFARGHLMSAMLGGLAACIVIGVGHPVMVMVALILAVMGQQSISAVLWALPSALLTGTAAAGGIAMINAIGNLGGFLGPWVFGAVKDASGSDSTALLCLALGPVNFRHRGGRGGPRPPAGTHSPAFVGNPGGTFPPCFSPCRHCTRPDNSCLVQSVLADFSKMTWARPSRFRCLGAYCGALIRFGNGPARARKLTQAGSFFPPAAGAWEGRK